MPSVTLAPAAKLAVHPLVAALPEVITHAMPCGTELTCPLPLAPPVMCSGYVLAAALKTAVAVRETSSVTSHDCGLSVTPVHPDFQLDVAPEADGVAFTLIVAPVPISCEHLPLLLTTPRDTVTVQLMPPRVEVMVPPTVLPWASTENSTVCAALRAPSSIGSLGALRSESHAYITSALAGTSSSAARTRREAGRKIDRMGTPMGLCERASAR